MSGDWAGNRFKKWMHTNKTLPMQENKRWAFHDSLIKYLECLYEYWK